MISSDRPKRERQQGNRATRHGGTKARRDEGITPTLSSPYKGEEGGRRCRAGFGCRLAAGWARPASLAGASGLEGREDPLAGDRGTEAGPLACARGSGRGPLAAARGSHMRPLASARARKRTHTHRRCGPRAGFLYCPGECETGVLAVPIYEYQCPACHATFEELIRSESAARKVVCPKCGDGQVTRRMSTFAAHAAPAKGPSLPGPCGQCRGADGSCPLGT